MKAELNSLYQQLPQVGEFVDGSRARELLREFPRPLVLEAVRSVLGRLRDEIASGALSEATLRQEIDDLHTQVAAVLRHRERQSLRSVINATGVILQTNLGRAPLSDLAIDRISTIARGYCSLELDLEAGERGQRGAHVEELLLRLVELDSATSASLVVNNCAGAAFLALDSIASGGEVIVSRGELVEIGGGFRVPDILRKSGARLVEVGTTNRTRIEDYAAAITAQTRLILRVHQSNFRIVGFTEHAEISELVRVATEAGVPLMIDQGTGCVAALAEHGIAHGSSFTHAVASGAALVCASGDKLLGGPQCGLLVGERGVIDRLRRNPLYRALRVDKLTLAALEATIQAYLSGQAQTIPILRMLAMDSEAIRSRCETWVRELVSLAVDASVIPVESTVGGGAAPGAVLPSFAVALCLRGTTAEQLASALRRLDPPVIARIRDNRVLLDLRTVPEDADNSTIRILREAFEAHVPQGGGSTGMDALR